MKLLQLYGSNFKSSSQKMKQWGAKIIGFISREWMSEGSWNFVQGIAWDMNFSWYLDRSSSKTYFPWSISPSLWTTNQSYLCNDVLTKKMVSQVWRSTQYYSSSCPLNTNISTTYNTLVVEVHIHEHTDNI
jgi:hypothetical protein